MARKQKSEKELVVSSAAAAAAPRRKPVTATRKKHSIPQAEKPVSSSVELQKPVSVAASYEPTFEEVSRLAYTYWEARGSQGGSPEEDWLRAEQELRVRVMAATAR
jgi:hypothetical protein